MTGSEERRREPPPFPTHLTVAAPQKIAWVAPPLLGLCGVVFIVTFLISALFVSPHPEIVSAILTTLATWAFFAMRSLRDPDYYELLRARMRARPSPWFGRAASLIAPGSPMAWPRSRIRRKSGRAISTYHP
jgi:hypothetical protein